MAIYAAMSAVQLLSTSVNGVEVARFGLRAARRLHDTMLNALLAAPKAFFDTTPPGRIINRCVCMRLLWTPPCRPDHGWECPHLVGTPGGLAMVVSQTPCPAFSHPSLLPPHYISA
jgi:hypothetical protein